MKKKIQTIKLLNIIALSALLLVACDKTSTKTYQKEKTLLHDDFYTYINSEWLDKTKIPADSPAINSFKEISNEIEKILLHDIDKMRSDSANLSIPKLQEFIKLYTITIDYEKRNQDGVTPLLPYLKRIEQLSSLEDLNKHIGELIRQGYTLPFSPMVSVDMKNANQHAFYFDSPSLFLSDTTYYEKNHQEGEKQTKIYSDMFNKLIIMLGKNAEEAKKITDNAMKFDALLSQYSLSNEESSNVSNLYNPYTFQEFTASSHHLNLDSTVTHLLNQKPKIVIVSNKKFMDNFDSIYNQNNFEVIKDWMYVNMITSYSAYLSQEFEEAGQEASMALSGIKELPSINKRAYYAANNYLGEALGMYYGQTYLGEKAKKNVTQMTENMIKEYKSRLKHNDWLSEKTKKEAIKKLDYMSIQIGYPTTLSKRYKNLIIDTEKTCLDNYMTLNSILINDMFSNISKPVDRTEWTIPAHEVNATYDPSKNTITFPAAILQAPFYSLEQTESQNYGGIGAVIGHEISHAFDSNGALFDENGNYKNWWTQDDYQEFEKRTNQVKNLFNGIEYAGGKVNGALTVTENIADAGGVNVAIKVLSQKSDANPAEFFANWAKIWRMKATPDYIREKLVVDTHAPAKIRANIQLSNQDDFYTAYPIKEGDGMYLKPEKRVTIW